MRDLTPEEEQELHGDLRDLRAELEQRLEASARAARPIDLEEPIGRVSRIDAIQQQSMIQANRRAAERRVQQVEAALRRLSAGEYGCCLGCGEGVGFARLKVRPETPLCFDCQTARENR